MDKKKIYLTIFKSLLYILLLVPFFKVDSISYLFPQYDILFNYAKLFAFVILIVLFIIDKRVSKIILYIGVYLGILCLSSLINPEVYLVNSIISFVSVLTMCMIVDYGVRHDLKILLNSLLFILFALCVVNFYTVIRYPYGIYINNDGFAYNWVLGYKNTLILYLFPLTIFSVLKSYVFKGRVDLFSILCFALSFVTIIVVDSSTGIIGLGIILLYFIFYKFFSNSELFNIRSYFITYLIAFISIIVLRIQKLFSFIIVNLLHKDLTFTGRTYIWDSVLEYIKQKPILGYGNQTYRYSTKVITTHNSVLDILYRSGLVGLCVYIFLIVNTLYKLFKNRKHKIAMFLSIALFAYFVMMFMEAFNISYYFYILVFCYNVEYLIDEANKHIRKDVK